MQEAEVPHLWKAVRAVEEAGETIVASKYLSRNSTKGWKTLAGILRSFKCAADPPTAHVKHARLMITCNGN